MEKIVEFEPRCFGRFPGFPEHFWGAAGSFGIPIRINKIQELPFRGCFWADSFRLPNRFQSPGVLHKSGASQIRLTLFAGGGYSAFWGGLLSDAKAGRPSRGRYNALEPAL